jgi:hypothetical protein
LPSSQRSPLSSRPFPQVAKFWLLEPLPPPPQAPSRRHVAMSVATKWRTRSDRGRAVRDPSTMEVVLEHPLELISDDCSQRS